MSFDSGFQANISDQSASPFVTAKPPALLPGVSLAWTFLNPGLAGNGMMDDDVV